MIQTQKYNVNQLFLSNELLKSYINTFWLKTFSRLILSRKNIHLLLLCKVQFSDNNMSYKTLADLRKVNFNDRELFTNYLIARLGILTEAYVSHPITKIEFSYVIKKGIALNNKKYFENIETKVTSTTHRFNNMVLPISMNPSDFGEIILSNQIKLDGELVNRFIVKKGARSYIIDSSLDNKVNKVRIQGAIDLLWTDTLISNNIFKREIGKSTIYFREGERILIKKVLSAKAYTPISVNSSLNNYFITMDIKTVDNKNIKTPYLICAFNGKDYITSYANENFDQKDLFNNFINQLLTFFISNKLTVYAHNLSGFVGILLMKHLIPFGKVKPVLFNGKLMSITLTLTINGYVGKKIIFKDSYLLLPLSLKKLCKAFGIDLVKGYFPFKFLNVYYTGNLPAFEHSMGLDLTIYNNMIKKNNNWSLTDEAIKYCKLDCKCLHKILIKFNSLIFNHFKLNIEKSLTLHSLAMRIYKTHYMPKNTIYQLLENVEKDIKQSYTGGTVDVYIPTNRKNILSLVYFTIKAFFTKLYMFDVNSLYPFIMAKRPMPVGKPIAFEGDITKVDPSAFGFFYCKITSPQNIKHPFLQRKINTIDGVKTIAGIGSWTGWIFSEEKNHAMKLGYQFEILKGYEFERGFIFKEYVEKMYSLRMEYAKSTPMNLIAKLLMNSLYGKFGMRLETTNFDIFDSNNEFELNMFNTLIDTLPESVKNWIKLDNYYITVKNNFIPYSHKESEDFYYGIDVNIGIASAITAGARIWMSFIKNTSKFNYYYSDTNSFVIDKNLPSYMIGHELGQLKLKYIIKNAVFLAPKVYAIVTSDNKLIIKVKGTTFNQIKELSFNDIEKFLIKDSSLEFNQEKWFKSVIEGEITHNDLIYTLKTIYNKRNPIYTNIKGREIFTNTRPYNYDKIINKIGK